MEAKDKFILPEFDSPNNYPEDYVDGHNQYVCKCYKCKEHFYGYKRRIICKECLNTEESENEIMEGKAKEALTKFQANKSDMDIMVNNNKMLLNSLTIEWLDSVNLFIEVYTTWESYNKVKQFSFKIVDENDKVLCDKWLSPYFNSRQEATEAAIKKAVEIYNEKLT